MKKSMGGRKTKTRAEKKVARRKNHRRIRMSRQKDVDELNARIKELEKVLQDTVLKYQTYARKVEATVKEILTKAGVWDTVHDMEVERNATREKAQAKINEVQQELVDKRKIRDYLVTRDNLDKGDVSPTAPTFDLDKEPEAPKLSEDAGKVVDISAEKSGDAPEKPEPPEL